MKRAVIVAVIVAAVGGGYYFYASRQSSGSSSDANGAGTVDLDADDEKPKRPVVVMRIPETTYSPSARRMRAIASARVGAHTQSFEISGS